MNSTEPIKVFVSDRKLKCDDCGENLRRQAWITLQPDKSALCLTCADLDHLSFLPIGDAALSRRARKHSELSAAVLKFSRLRKRFERVGLLIEEGALQQAENECLADGEIIARRSEREQILREELDYKYIQEFANLVSELFPNCPSGRELEIAEYACRKYSNNAGRSASAKVLDEKSVRRAVQAHIRHRETDYDSVLGHGFTRTQARTYVGDRVNQISETWK